MRHSQKIALVLLGSVSALSLAACEDKPTDGDPIFESVQECKNNSGTLCEDKWYKAMSTHVSSAPKYNSEGNCLAQGHDKCTSVSSPSGTGNIWLPAMVGFMTGRALNDAPRPVYLQGYPNPTNPREQEDRRVMAGGSHTTPVMVGNYYGGGGGYTSGSLSSGMSQGASRAGWSAKPSSSGGPAVSSAATAARTMPASVATASRGGFGGSGAGMGSSGGG
jgi:uncharacterized protein YgiB involved in biofilm formation